MRLSRSLLASLLVLSMVGSTSIAHASAASQPRPPGLMTKLKTATQRFFGRTPAQKPAGKQAMALSPAKTAAKTAEGERPSFLDRMELKVVSYTSSRSYLGALVVGLGGWALAHNVLGDPTFSIENFGISILTLGTGILVQRQQEKAAQRDLIRAKEDRIRAEKDLKIDIKSEKEIAALHGKIDKLGEQIENMAAALAAQAAVNQAAGKAN